MKSLLAPQMAPDKSEHITERGDGLAITGHLSDRNVPIGLHRLSKECHYAKEAKEQGS
ncbi:MAG: hypothetical protein NVS4B12_20020 [Ktedonobacteraceae bacterium]